MYGREPVTTDLMLMLMTDSERNFKARYVQRSRDIDRLFKDINLGKNVLKLTTNDLKLKTHLLKQFRAARAMEAKQHKNLVLRIAARARRRAIKNEKGAKVMSAKGTTLGKKRVPCMTDTKLDAPQLKLQATVTNAYRNQAVLIKAQEKRLRQLKEKKM